MTGVVAEPAAVVFDLDGTLVDLAVDWEVVRREVQGVYRAAGVSADETNQPLWSLLADAADHDLEGAVERTIARHERAGAPRSTRLPAADTLVGIGAPAGVCSLNCEAACRLALRRHGLLESVEVVVGRDSVDAWKPDPEPLLTVIDALAAEPAETVFIGDSDRDALTASRAGTAFCFVDEWLAK